MKNIYHFIKKRKTLFGGAALLLLVLAYLFRGNSSPAVKTVTVSRGAIVQEVSVTGKTKAVSTIDLTFEKSGKITRVPATIGDHVVVGQVLVELDRSELLAQLAETSANVLAQEAKLAELQRGSRPEDIQIQQTELKTAEQNLKNEYQSVFDVVNDAYTKADDAVRKQLADLFSNSEAINPNLTFTVYDSQKEIDAEFKRQQASTALNSWQQELDDLVANPTDRALIDKSLENAKSHLLLIREFLNTTMDAVVNSGLAATTASTYKSYITTARTNIATALTNVTSQEQAIASQKIVVARTTDQLNLKLAGSTTEQIAAQQAAVKQARANSSVIEAQLSKSVLRSPIAGILIKQEAKVGEIATPNAPLVSVISDGKLEIEANIPEADIVKIKIADPVRITFDAFGEDTKFSGHVAFVDPAETVIEGVPTYKTTFQLDQENPAVKPGLTANLDIVTEELENVLLIPQRSLVYRGDKKVVQIYRAGLTATEEREVTTGLRGSDGNIQILTGLAEGDLILSTPL